MIVSDKPLVKYTGISILVIFFQISFAVYWTMRKKESMAEDVGIARYKHKGKMLLVHGIVVVVLSIAGLCVVNTYILISIILLGGFFLCYEGYRALHGWKFFIPVKS